MVVDDVVSDFELAYGAFCRSYQLPMESVTTESLAALGLPTVGLPLAEVRGAASGYRILAISVLTRANFSDICLNKGAF